MLDSRIKFDEKYDDEVCELTTVNMEIEMYDKANFYKYIKIGDEEWNAFGLLDCCDRLLSNNGIIIFELARNELMEESLTMRKLINKELAFIVEGKIYSSKKGAAERTLRDMKEEAMAFLTQEETYEKMKIKSYVELRDKTFLKRETIFEAKLLLALLEMLENTSKEAPITLKMCRTAMLPEWYLMFLKIIKVVTRTEDGEYYIADRVKFNELYNTIIKYKEEEGLY